MAVILAVDGWSTASSIAAILSALTTVVLCILNVRYVNLTRESLLEQRMNNVIAREAMDREAVGQAEVFRLRREQLEQQGAAQAETFRLQHEQFEREAQAQRAELKMREANARAERRALVAETKRRLSDGHPVPQVSVEFDRPRWVADESFPPGLTAWKPCERPSHHRIAFRMTNAAPVAVTVSAKMHKHGAERGIAYARTLVRPGDAWSQLVLVSHDDVLAVAEHREVGELTIEVEAIPGTIIDRFVASISRSPASAAPRIDPSSALEFAELYISMASPWPYASSSDLRHQSRSFPSVDWLEDPSVD